MLTVLGKIIYSSVLIVLGIFLNRFFESRPRLITYYGHVAAGKVRIDNQSPTVGINTHSIVIANTGRKPALKVRVGHYPRIKDVQNMIAIHPAQRFDIEATPDAGEEVIFERILPKQAITITYIYSSGLTFNQITAYVRSDESEAKFLPVTINRWFPRWFLNILLALVFIGFVTVVYYGYTYGMVLLARLNLLNSLPSP